MMVTLGLGDLRAWVIKLPPGLSKLYQNRLIPQCRGEIARALSEGKIHPARSRFDFSRFCARRRFTGNDKQTVGWNLGGEKPVAHRLGALVSQSAHVVVTNSGVLEYQAFHFGYRQRLCQADGVARLWKTFRIIRGAQQAFVFFLRHLNLFNGFRRSALARQLLHFLSPYLVFEGHTLEPFGIARGVRAPGDLKLQSWS